jgi:hypothetical protein
MTRERNLGEGVFDREGFLRRPPMLLLTALANLQSRHHIYGNQISHSLKRLSENNFKFEEEPKKD